MRWPFAKKILSHDPLEGYDIWSATYDLENNPIKNFSDSFIKKQIPNLSGFHVLDAGCGTGTFCKLAEDLGAKKVVGIDLSPEMTRQASIKCPSAEFMTVDLSKIKLNTGSFDLVVCGLVLGHVEQFSFALNNLCQSLKPGGTLIISDFHPYQSLLKARRTFKDKENNVHEIVHHANSFSDYFKVFENQMTVSVFEEHLYKKEPVVFGMKAIKL